MFLSVSLLFWVFQSGQVLLVALLFESFVVGSENSAFVLVTVAVEAAFCLLVSLLALVPVEVVVI